ncbi:MULTISPECIES: LytTR family DNA-binding domain-containing protein [unclassified Butyrivibrio]|uniref:LytTR family DNA-binding domain-containing protein n=1 Tax=unclassified Butyrivibrio TaxID=2639466 RepID=UPI0003B48813|nr:MULTISPECIES: LytTR family DNA-binding domain-containing protein [unclassified Butyrivibrio]SDB08497.1 LytTr DNA-binding domain-containing protein [Butyrivibrio sp. INlla16]SEM30522.1 LytTr DNA-binding domain-containing protein [Butyrivibrio sp. ob235]
MRVTFNKIPQGETEYAVINAHERTSSIDTVIGLLENGEQMILGYKDGESVPCAISKIYYFETVDDKCFAYTKDDCLEIKSRLYEVEGQLDYRFFRCSKSMICNIRKIKSVKAESNARMRATLLNGEPVIITRSYVKEMKNRLGL